MPTRQTSLLFQVATPGLGRRDARAFAKRLESEGARGRSFCCLITNDEELGRLKRQFRQKGYAPDVLSFPAHENDDGVGEIPISFAKASQQAAERRRRVG